MADKENTPPDIELDDALSAMREEDDGNPNIALADAFVPPDVEDAETAAEPEGGPPKMSKTDMIAKGLLPPRVKKDKLAAAVQKETGKEAANMQEMPIEQMQQAMLRQPPKHASTINTEDLIKKASARGGMALELIKAILANVSKKPLFDDVDDMVSYAFEIADGIQAETDVGYNKSLVAAATQQLK